MNNSPIGQQTNMDDAFIRRVIVAMQSFLYEKVSATQLENGVMKKIPVPVQYSQNGEEQFLVDYFMDTDKYFEDLGQFKVKGQPIVVPSMIITISGFTLNTQFLTSKYTRSIFKRRISTPFGDAEKMVSARTAMIPCGITWDVTVTTNSDLQRAKLTENIIKTFYRAKKFKYGYDGFDSLPCTVGFPANYDIHKDLKWQYPGVDTDLRPRLKFTLDSLTYMPNPDEETIRYVDNQETNTIITKQANNPIA